jgi:hypothetical protein
LPVDRAGGAAIDAQPRDVRHTRSGPVGW